KEAPYFYQQVAQRDVSRRLQVGPELICSLRDSRCLSDLEQDRPRLDKTVDELTGWVNSSNYKVALLGIDIVGTLADRMLERFKGYLGAVLPVLIDRLGDSKDQVREQSQALILRLMEQAAPYVWERLLPGFKHKNFRSREGICLCLSTTLNMYGAQPLTLSKIVPFLCTLTGDQNAQVREMATASLVDVYRHVGERVRADMNKRGLPAARSAHCTGVWILGVHANVAVCSLSCVRARAHLTDGKPLNSGWGHRLCLRSQIYSTRDLDDNLNKIREILSDDKHDWDQRTNALKKVRSLLVAGAPDHECFFQHLRLLDGAFKLSAKDLRSQVVREACITVAHLSTVLGNKFDHGAEAIVPILFNLIPNSAKVMSTSGVAAIRIIIRHTHVPRLIPLIASNCTSKSVAVRRRCYEFLDLLLQEWQTHSLERHTAVLVDSIKKGIRDADAEARVEARKAYWGLRQHFPSEADVLFHSLEASYQRNLQSCVQGSLPQSDRSSSSSQESLNRPLSSKWSAAPGRGGTLRCSKTTVSPASLQRSRSDVDVNAAAGAKARHDRQAGASARLATAGLPAGTYASLGRLRTKQTLSTVSGTGSSQVDSRGRSRSKVVSQSQRTYPCRVRRHLLDVSSVFAEKRSRIPRSQGCSRDSSPTRLSVGKNPLQSARLSSSISAMRVLNTGSDMEEALADALLLGDARTKKAPRRRYETYGMYSDDDANSDASSVCSERSYSSRNGSIPTYMRQTEDVAEVLNRCASTNWSERKEGLLGLQSMLKSQRTLSRVELKRLCEIFTRMFADPHSKVRVFSMFLETLVDFVHVHKEDLQDWLFVLLTQLLKKMGADLLGSVQAKVQRALDVTRWSFPNDLQFTILMRFTVDQTQTPNLKVKVAILRYIETLALQMDPGDFVNSSETRLAVSRIITWTTEPKSSDVRKVRQPRMARCHWLLYPAAPIRLACANGCSSCWSQAAQSVLISLFQLNTPEFTMLLGALPKTFQDGATKLLQSHLRSSGSNSGSQAVTGSPLIRHTPRSPASWSSPLTSPTNCPSTRVIGSAFDYDTENMNSEDIYSSLRGVTEAIQNFSVRSQEDMSEPLRRDAKRDGDGDAVSATLSTVDSGRTALDNKTSLLNTMPVLQSSPRGVRDYGPIGCSDSSFGSPISKSAFKEAMFDDESEPFPEGRRDTVTVDSRWKGSRGLDQSELVAELLKELSNHNERVEERKAALCELLKLLRDGQLLVWDEHFKTILLLLLETLGDHEHVIRALALRVLKEILHQQPSRFKNYAELTIMKALEAHKDPHKEVVRAAEETAAMLASSISAEQCVKVLCPIIQTAEYPINLAAIKMQTKVIDRLSRESLQHMLPEMVPGLILGYDNSESSVRKACVFCLVAIHSVLGDELKPHLTQLSGSKVSSFGVSRVPHTHPLRTHSLRDVYSYSALWSTAEAVESVH
uniref:Cytoplasmic linker associated protein 2 n=1 Tax=Scleropages formosus TaxID=113540 RepID=A0A8C9W1W8_SCLFO